MYVDVHVACSIGNAQSHDFCGAQSSAKISRLVGTANIEMRNDKKSGRRVCVVYRHMANSSVIFGYFTKPHLPSKWPDCNIPAVVSSHTNPFQIYQVFCTKISSLDAYQEALPCTQGWTISFCMSGERTFPSPQDSTCTSLPLHPPHRKFVGISYRRGPKNPSKSRMGIKRISKR